MEELKDEVVTGIKPPVHGSRACNNFQKKKIPANQQWSRDGVVEGVLEEETGSYG